MSTAYEFDMDGIDTPEDLAGNDYTPPEPGTYHLAITSVNMQPVTKDSVAKDGIEISFEVQAGTVEGQEKRAFKECFYWPKATNKDGGAFLRKRLARLGMVTGVISPDALGTKAAVAWEDMAARHFVAAVHHESFTSDKGNEINMAKIDGLKMWHVASPEVAAIPKDEEVLELMPMGADPFSGAKTAAPKPAPQPAPKAAAQPAAARKTKPAPAPAPAKAPPAAPPANDPYADL